MVLQFIHQFLSYFISPILLSFDMDNTPSPGGYFNWICPPNPGGKNTDPPTNPNQQNFPAPPYHMPYHPYQWPAPPNQVPYLPNQIFPGMAPNIPQYSPPLPTSKNSQSASMDDVQTPTSHPQMEVLADTDEEPFAGATGCRARMMCNEDDDIRLVSLISLSAWSYNHVSVHLFKISYLN